MKDLFSTASDQYAKYRPTYPDELFDFLNSLVPDKQNAWDCATGNGQVAFQLAKTFEQVFATDISQPQLDNAMRLPLIEYSLQPAEETSFPDDLFNLVTVGQAIHWFDFDKFYAEVNRTAKASAVLAVIGYGRITISPEIDDLVTDFYEGVIGKYWDKERRYIDEQYRTIPFPFAEIETPAFATRLVWTIDHLFGYLNTWSAVKHFIKANSYNPLEELRTTIDRQWGMSASRQIEFPLLVRTGRIKQYL